MLVDTGAGNDRDRAAMPPLHHLNTDFLGALRHAGVEPEAVDVVVNTHLHTDHVGWNTKRDGDSWVPTFPNARYVIPEADNRYFDPEHADARPPARSDDEQARHDLSRIVWADSIAPVWLDAGKSAVFVGDLTHTPIQLHRPADPCAFDEDYGAAAVTRGDGFMVDDWLQISAL